MSYLTKVLMLLAALFASASWAQQTRTPFLYNEIVLVEDAVESTEVVVAYSEASGVVEVRFKECDKCEYRTLFPAPSISFSVGGKSMTAKAASEHFRNSPGTVVFDASTSKVNRIQYFQARDGGEE